MRSSTLLLSLFFCVLGAASLQAQVVQYTDRAAWEAAVVAAGGVVKTENFNNGSTFTGVDEGVAVGPPISSLVFDTGDTMTTPLVKIYTEVGSGGQQFSYSDPGGTSNEQTDGTPFLFGFGTNGGAPKIRIERPTGGGTLAWGVDYRKNSTTTTWRAELVPTVGSVTTYTLPAGAVTGFIGWVVSDGYIDLKALRLFSPAAGYVYCGYDNVSMGVPSPGTPEADIVVEAPALLLDGGTKDFGTPVNGVPSDVIFTARNIGTVDLTGLAVTVDGTDAGAWQIVAQPSATLAAGATTTWTMRFAPATTGGKVAALHLASSVERTRNPYDINLTGVGVTEIEVQQPAGLVVTDGGSKALPGVTVGTSQDFVFTVKNLGYSDLTLGNITIDGLHAAEFSVSSSPGASVSGGATATFTIRFAPTSLGAKSAALHFSNNDADENPFDLNLTATARSSASLSGFKTIGPTGDFATIGAAIVAVQTSTLTGPLVLELQPTYVSTVETFPLVFTDLGTTAANTLTIRPASGATGLSISSADTTAATVDLNGAQFVTFDGRPGGIGSNAGSGGGTASQLTIENTSTSGIAVRYINEAISNTLRYTTLRGVNTSTFSGTVVFSTTTGANGNDNNTLDHCDLRDGASTPTNCLFANGTAAPADNSGNTVSNCNVFNFYSSNSGATGVSVTSGNTAWSITGNSFYQTNSRAAVLAYFSIPILISSLGDSFTVTGNYMGGDSPGAAVTLQKWTTTGTSVSYSFRGIQINVGTTTPSSVQGNTIANMVWTSSSNATTLPGLWSGIYVQGGRVNVGTVTGNTIGSGTGTNSISVTTSGTGGTSFGIGSISSDTVAIANNTIGSITTSGADTSGNPSTAVSASLVGIQVTAGTNAISNNTVGSTTTANSLNAATSSTAATGQRVSGILSSSTISANITGNTVANLNNSYAGTANGTLPPGSVAGQIRGIVTSAGVNTITGNTVRNLSTTSANSNSTTNQSVYGIVQTSTLAGQTVSQNTVHSLTNSAASAAVNVTGIYFAGPTSGANVIARNLVHSLAVSSSSGLSQVKGMEFSTGVFTAQNNMVGVGLKADGSSTAPFSTVRGIYDNGTTAGRNFYHNSVFVGGAHTGSTNSFALQSTGVTNSRTFQNNIFTNGRSGGTGKHFAITHGGTTVNPTGLTTGGNLLFSSGVLATYNSVDRTTLAAWQAATGQDATSAVADPLFVNATGDASTVDLHLQASNPAEGSGIPLTDALSGAPVTVADDFDGQTRGTLTPTDIGADAGNFTLTSDTFAPGISYLLLTSGSTANRVLTGWATITDNSGSVSSELNAPRLYFKKSTDADAFGGNTSTDNGWKYITATGSGPYSFTIDYTLINGGSVSIGDTIQYFVVAQDAANNLGSSPAGATALANPPVQNISAKPGAGVNSFSIVGTISGTKTVGTGGDYPSLSGAGGLFAALNASVLTGNVVVNIMSDLIEDGSTVLNALPTGPEYPFPNYTLTLQPDSATMRTISGTATAGLITLNGADRVTIDGRFGGSGRYLTLRNTNTVNTASTLRLQNDSSSNTIRNCVVEGASIGGNGVIGISTGTVTGNDNNLFTANQVRDRSDAAGVPLRLIVSGGSSVGVANSGNTISNNELFNFNGTGISIGNQGDEGWTISGNHIYEVNAATDTSVRGVEFFGTGNAANFITGNHIHDLVTVAGQSLAIIFVGAGPTTISGNRITAFNVNAAMTDVRGITAQGGNGSTVNIVNNQITLIPTTAGSTLLGGIYDTGTAGSVVNAFHNSIVIGGTETGSRNSWGNLRMQSDTHTSRNNLLLNFRTGGTGSHFAAGNEGTGGSYTASNNVYAGTGATAANFMDFGNNTTTPVSFATWQTSTGDTSTSGSNPGGNYSAAMFVNAATGDLHLIPGGNVLVNGAGTPIAGVTTDYDGDPRSLTTPIIGSDEIPLPDIAVTQTRDDVNNQIDVADGDSYFTDTVGYRSSSSAFTFTITNPGTADLTGLAFAPKDGANPGDFTVSALSGTTVPASGGSVTFTVTFTPSAIGARSAGIHITSNVVGAKNPYDITLTGDAIEPNNAPTITSNGGGASASISVDENSTAVTTVIAIDNDTPAQTITYSKSGPDAALFNINSTNGTLTFVAAPDFETNPGPFNITVTATDNGSLNLSDSQALTISVSDLADTPQQLWRAANFPGIFTNTGNAANNADPDGDTYSNLLEFAFGTDPNNSASGPGEIAFNAGAITLRAQPKLTVTNSPTSVDFRANFGRRKDYVTAELTYKVQFSADMQTWVDGTATPTVQATDAELEAVSVKYPFFLPDGRKARYHRVQVNVP